MTKSSSIIKTVDLDEFSKTWHNKSNVPREIHDISNELYDKYLYSDYSAPAPITSIHQNPEEVFRGLKIIELNPTELCNRTCHFCPRYDPNVYPNQNLNMSLDTVTNLIRDLIENNYYGMVYISGMGEPLLNKDILNIIHLLRKANIYTCMITNGDKILQESWYTLNDFIDAGLSCINVDVYDNSDQYFKWKDMLSKVVGRINFQLQPRFVELGSTFGNRTGMSTHESINQTPRPLPCFSPAVKSFIDWDGSVMLCCHDWSRSAGKFGNVNDEPFHQIWNSQSLNEIRFKLMNGSRLNCEKPCNNCSVAGNQSDSFIKNVWNKALTYSL